jgi:hypothetical protein
MFKNIHSFETIYGLKSIGLISEDLTDLPITVDVLVIGVYRGSYNPHKGTLIETLYNIGINLKKLAEEPELDMRKSCGIWLSKEIMHNKIHRIACVEFVSYGEKISDKIIEKRLNAIFSMIAASQHMGININSISMPLLGTGKIKIDPKRIIKVLLEKSRNGLESLRDLNQIIISVIDDNLVESLSNAMDEYLGRTDIELSFISIDDSTSIMINNIIEDLKEIIELRYNLIDCDSHQRKLLKKHRDILLEVLKILENTELHKGFELEIFGRRLLEVMISDLSEENNNNLLYSRRDLNNNIDILAKNLKMAKWIATYMHIIRVIGNTAAHINIDNESKPSQLEKIDFRILIDCLSAVLPYWKSEINSRKGSIS